MCEICSMHTGPAIQRNGAHSEVFFWSRRGTTLATIFPTNKRQLKNSVFTTHTSLCLSFSCCSYTSHKPLHLWLTLRCSLWMFLPLSGPVYPSSLPFYCILSGPVYPLYPFYCILSGPVYFYCILSGPVYPLYLFIVPSLGLCPLSSPFYCIPFFLHPYTLWVCLSLSLLVLPEKELTQKSHRKGIATE